LATSTAAQGAGGDLNEAWWAASGPDGVQRVNIRCGPDFFDPRHIVVKANVPVQLSVSTTIELPAHQFTVTLGPVAIDAPIGAVQKPFRLSPSLTGKFQAFCRSNGPPDSLAASKARRASSPSRLTAPGASPAPRSGPLRHLSPRVREVSKPRPSPTGFRPVDDKQAYCGQANSASIAGGDFTTFRESHAVHQLS
jgi:hypothetical protein